jgi:XTP/dITP diphosphohydrolase
MPSVLDGVPFGQPALSLAAQLQRRAQRAGITASAMFAGDAPVTAGTTVPAGATVPAGTAVATGSGAAVLTGERAGDALMALVARVREAGLDPELELRAAARRFARLVREQEQSAGSTAG